MIRASPGRLGVRQGGQEKRLARREFRVRFTAGQCHSLQIRAKRRGRFTEMPQHAHADQTLEFARILESSSAGRPWVSPRASADGPGVPFDRW